MNEKPYDPCRHCVGAFFCRLRKVDLAVRDILRLRLIRTGDSNETLWSDSGRWAKIKPKNWFGEYYKKWATWREFCTCCGTYSLVFMRGLVKLRVNRRCGSLSVPLNVCKCCEHIVRKASGDRAFLSYRQQAVLGHEEDARRTADLTMELLHAELTKEEAKPDA